MASTQRKPRKAGKLHLDELVRPRLVDDPVEHEQRANTPAAVVVTLPATGSAGLAAGGGEHRRGDREQRREREQDVGDPERLPGAEADGDLDVAAADLGDAAGRVPVEEHHREQAHAAGGGDQLARAQAAQLHPAPTGCCGGGLRREQRVAQQHRDRHRPDAAGHRRDQPGALRRPPRSHDVAHRAADVDHRRAGLDPVALDQPRLPDGGDEHVGAAADGGEVAGARVADGDGGVGVQQQRGDRAADEVGAADDDRLGALEPDVVAAQQLHHPGRRAGAQPGPALDEQAGGDRRQPVDVLARRDLRGQARAVDLRRGRELEQDARTRAGRRRAP